MITAASNNSDNIRTNSKTTKSKKTRIGRKRTLWILQATNWRDCTQEDMFMAKKKKPQERNCISKQCLRTNYVKAKINDYKQGFTPKKGHRQFVF